MSIQQIPDTLLTTIEVPEGTGVMIHTFVCPISEDGTLTLPTGYTRDQQQALIAYFTYNDEHLRVSRGARLTIVPEEQQTLLDAAIELLKSPAQRFRERVEQFVLSQHTPHGEHWKYWMSFFREVTYPPHKQAWVDEHKLDAMATPLYEVLITEGRVLAMNDRAHPPYEDTEYRVAHNRDTDELAIIASWKGLSNFPDEDDA